MLESKRIQLNKHMLIDTVSAYGTPSLHLLLGGGGVLTQKLNTCSYFSVSNFMFFQHFVFF